MPELEAKILRAPLSTDPFPHFVIDNFLDRATLEGIKSLWPAGPRRPEAPGNFLIYLGTRDAATMRGMSDVQRSFWRDFIARIQDEIIPATVRRYGDWVGPRYPGLSSIELAALSLMETDGRFVQHGSHTHHWHDPTWLFTNLIYVDDDSDDRGTAIYRVRTQGSNDPDHAAIVAANTRHWMREGNWSGNPDLELARVIEFVPNRLFSFFESPVSFHGVEPAAARDSKRRVVRMHIRAPRVWVRRLYGVSPGEYKRRREAAECSPEILGWMRRDIEQLMAPRQVPFGPIHCPRIRVGSSQIVSNFVWLADKVLDRVRAWF